MNEIALFPWPRSAPIPNPPPLLPPLRAVQDDRRGRATWPGGCVPRPFAFDELLARLRALERRKTSTLQVTTHLHLGSLSLNLLTREIQVDGVPVALTVREFALLEYLLRHPHQALTRTQILAAVWPSDTEVNTTIVDTYIHYLRTKIDRYPGPPS